jgi:hypothetical protein
MPTPFHRCLYSFDACLAVTDAIGVYNYCKEVEFFLFISNRLYSDSKKKKYFEF